MQSLVFVWHLSRYGFFLGWFAYDADSRLAGCACVDGCCMDATADKQAAKPAPHGLEQRHQSQQHSQSVTIFVLRTRLGTEITTAKDNVGLKAGLQTQCGVNSFILDSRRVLAPAPKVLGPKHISNPDFAPF